MQTDLEKKETDCFENTISCLIILSLTKYFDKMITVFITIFDTSKKGLFCNKLNMLWGLES